MGLWRESTEFARGGVGRGARVVPPPWLVLPYVGKVYLLRRLISECDLPAARPAASADSARLRSDRAAGTVPAWLAGSPLIMMITVAW